LLPTSLTLRQNKHHQSKERCPSTIQSHPSICTGRLWLLSVQYHNASAVQEFWPVGALILIPLTRQPVVSTANIAQLAVDLLIASFSLRVIGVFDSRDLVPVVGGREGEEEEEEGISTPLECELRILILILQFPFPSVTQRSLHSVWQRRVRHCGHSTAVTRTSGTSLLQRPSRAQAVQYSTPLTRILPSPDEKARVHRFTAPVSPRIKTLCNSFFVRRRHVQ
jgi:PAC2 family